MAKIKGISAREIFNCKGWPTIETTVVLSDNNFGTASCPSGTSVGNYEALELRDHDRTRFEGMGVLKAIENIEKLIAPKLIGIEVNHQQDIDRIMIELDGTQNKGRLGANAMLSVSMAACKAAARSSVLPPYLYLREFLKGENLPIKIPVPMFNVINGGAHAGGNIDMQEFLIIPATFKTFTESMSIGVSLYHDLKKSLVRNSLTTLVGDEGGFGPIFSTNEEALSFIHQVINSSPYRIGYDVFLGVDAAANNFLNDREYKIKDKAMTLSAKELINFYEEISKKYKMLYLEDPLSENDWDGWTALFQKIGQTTIVVGDDLTVTNPYRLQMALDKKAIGGIIIKPNQIGTVIEALAVVEAARAVGIKIAVSHRSGETNDDFIADFAVAVSADYVKFGAPARGERVGKYNRLLEIESQLKKL